MKSQFLATAALLSTICLTTPAKAADTEHLNQLLTTKQCPNCDLSGAGLVMADLSGANLSGANLTGANLSRANLTGADLRGANLVAAGLFGVNFTGANLSGADLTGSDLRDTYLVNADLTGAKLTSAYLQGAIGIPTQIAKPEDFYGLGVAAAQEGNHKQAVYYFNQAIASKPDYGIAYLARGAARFQMLDRKGALEDAQVSEKLFLAQNNTEALQISQNFIKELEKPPTPTASGGKSNFLSVLGGIASLLLRFLF